ncbi:hypothetical protein DL769_011319 [Monosporascus sp. CRB-8-3]|nr:hypothetical protein DL769_011319 [Monosporascus sp. CRB-8-3]
MAAANGNTTIVSMLLEADADTEARDAMGETSLLLAAANGHKDVVKLLLDKNAEVNARGYTSGRTALLWAVKNRHEAVASLLIDRGADIEAKESSSIQLDNPAKRLIMTPLAWAAKNGDEGVAKLLLNKGAVIKITDSHKQQPLYLAIDNGHESVVRLLLEWGAYTDDSWQHYSGWVLERAATLGNGEILKLLVLFGRAQNFVIWGPTSLLMRGRCRSEAAVRVLLDLGADKDGYRRRGQAAPLHHAAVVGNIAAVRLLLDHGAEVDPTDGQGWTPLHKAVRYGHKEVVEVLLDRGADASARTTKTGLSAPALALEGRNQEILQLLNEKLRNQAQGV